MYHNPSAPRADAPLVSFRELHGLFIAFLSCHSLLLCMTMSERKQAPCEQRGMYNPSVALELNGPRSPKKEGETQERKRGSSGVSNVQAQQSHITVQDSPARATQNKTILTRPGSCREAGQARCAKNGG